MAEIYRTIIQTDLTENYLNSIKMKDWEIIFLDGRFCEEKTKELIKGIWPYEEFRPWNCDKSRHVHEVISFEESNEEIKNKMEKVLNEVKSYRDKEFPLK